MPASKRELAASWIYQQAQYTTQMSAWQCSVSGTIKFVAPLTGSLPRGILAIATERAWCLQYTTPSACAVCLSHERRGHEPYWMEGVLCIRMSSLHRGAR
jgi:hypothetical protein